MIEAIQLTKFYDNTPALTDVSFQVEKGEILGFLGPNGAGKTTTMRILTGFIPPTSGTAKVAGFDVLSQSMEVRKRIGYMPENPPLYNEMTVTSFLKFLARLKRVPKAKEKQRIDSVVQKCSLESVTGRLIGHLSRGFRQRVGLAQALIQDPEVLILDEPTIGLDPSQIIEIRQLIRGLAGEHTVILSSHILPEVEQTCGKVVIINKGKIIAVDTPEKLSVSLRGANVYHLIVRKPSEELKSKITSIAGVNNVREESNGTYVIEGEKEKDIREEVAELVVNEKAGLLEFKSIAFTLEDVFVQLTTAEQVPATQPVS
ncbi:ABC transporter ATP-binding protein [bacterium]|nr:ABC transporter ATP-binding protein [bacterium]MCI0604609.1 ABC transporter ATP-binding protein [bacterium]